MLVKFNHWYHIWSPSALPEVIHEHLLVWSQNQKLNLHGHDNKLLEPIQSELAPSWAKPGDLLQK